MRINNDHMYHGAALTQIADRPEFKAINPFKGLHARGAFRINDDIGIYIKHAAEPAKTIHSEYLFGFSANNLAEIDAIKKQCSKVFIVLVCIQAKEICVLTLAERSTSKTAKLTTVLHTGKMKHKRRY